MVYKCDLLTSIQLVGLSNAKALHYFYKVLLFSVNDTLYDPAEKILELMATIWSYTTSPREYTIQYRGRAISYDGNFNKLFGSLR